MLTIGILLERQPNSGLVGTAGETDPVRVKQSAKGCLFLTSQSMDHNIFHLTLVIRAYGVEVK